MNRRQYLQVISVGLVSGAGCTLPLPQSSEPVEPGSVQFDNRTSEQVDLVLYGWMLDTGRTPTETVSEDSDVTLALTAPAESTVTEPEVFSQGNWRIRARAGGYESTVDFEIRDRAFIDVTLYSDRIRIGMFGNNG